MSGEVVVAKNTEGERTIDVARYLSGESFGELSILDGRPRGATAKAASETTLLIFPERGISFQELLQRHPEVFAQILHKLLAIVAGRIRSTNALISAKSPWVQAMQRRFVTDELTGLYNRAFLEGDFARLLSGYGEESSLFMVKPDDFKAINDTYGHEAGDAALKVIADGVGANLAGRELAVRYRGNEIAVICPGSGEAAALERAELLRRYLASLDIVLAANEAPHRISVSIGVASFPRDAATAGELVERAFAAMWQARLDGGNRVYTVKAVAS